MNSDQRPSGRSVMASRPSSSACQVSSGLFISPGSRVDRPTIAMSTRSAGPLRDQSMLSSAVVSRSGSPSTIRVASDSMVGCWNATATESVTPVMSSISAAIATASRDDKPNSTIGTDSSIASGDCPTAWPTQLRSHWRISGTVISALSAGALIRGEFSWESGSMSAMGYLTHSYPVAKAVGEPTPLRRLPSRYAARHARRPILPLEVRGIVPADTSSTSRTVTPCRTAIAARMSSAMG